MTRRAKSLHVVDVTDCESCPFFSDDDRNGPQCGCPRAEPLAAMDQVRLRYSFRAKRVLVDATGAKCPLLRQDVTVQRST